MFRNNNGILRYTLAFCFSFLTCKCFGLDDPIESYAADELDDDVKMAMLVDETNAYSFLYPVQVPGKKSSFRW
jgi:hypothetical protein